MLRTRRRGTGLPVNAEIQITNLVDVAFVLLIIFMITAPILQGGIEVTLPEAEATPLTSNDPIIVSVASNGDVFIGETRVTMAEFETVMRTYLGDDPTGRSVNLKGDMNATWGRGTEVMGLLKSMGVEDVGIVVEPVQGS
ncbi:MAG TPA: biopolymer transporter ExbD [Longimicrobiales bacterium]|nr:biopolymer transporter ExbD [Longimicrobiales bacterium]